MENASINFNRNSLIGSNRVGKRLTWVREKLGVTAKEAAFATEIPQATLCGWEYDVRSGFYEGYWLLANFYNELWQEKFKDSPQTFESVEIDEITVSFLMFGVDQSAERIKEMARQYNKELLQKEMELLEMKNQLELFSKGED